MPGKCSFSSKWVCWPDLNIMIPMSLLLIGIIIALFLAQFLLREKRRFVSELEQIQNALLLQLGPKYGNIVV